MSAVLQVAAGGYAMTTHRVLNRRGVMWLGQTCNIRCYFCYFLDKINAREHPEHAMMPLEKAKEMCRVLREHYGLSSVDIQGGEPTVWGPIFDLVAYCSRIGLKPTLITNGIMLAKKDVCQRLRDAGIYDFLFSIHGIGETYDRIVGLPGGSKKQMQALANLRELGIPFRLNCVLSKPVVEQLPELAELAFRSGARAMNFIAFNPFVDQTSGKRDSETVATYAEVMRKLTPILDEFGRRNVECNVRYFPFCVFEERHRKYAQNFQQILYDLHEWEAASEVWTSQPNQRRSALPLSAPPRIEEVIWHRRLLRLERSGPRWLRRAAGRLMQALKRHYQPGAAASPREVRIGVASIGRGPAAGGAARHQAPPPMDHPLLPFAIAVERVIKLVQEALGNVPRLPWQEYLHLASRRLMPLSVHSFSKCGACGSCDVASICDGFQGDYGELFGFAEARPIRIGHRVVDPKHYMAEQLKVVEVQEYDWAMPAPPAQPVRPATPRSAQGAHGS
jgi:MoaA/NifB/PqqE/SkfB family radical SAM enzyme